MKHAMSIITVAIFIIGMVVLMVFNIYEMGYKNGQIDFAQQRITWTVSGGLIIKIEGFAKPRMAEGKK